jgi:hypothetical protein
VSWWRLGEDAYFVSNNVTIPNQITGGQTGTGSGTQTAMLVGDAPGSYANGLGSSLDVLDRIGDAPESTANSVSINMIPNNRHSYPAGYTPTQVTNAFSMEFDGVDDLINCGNPTELQFTSDFSISGWFKTSSTASQRILSKDDGTNRSYYIQLNGNSYLRGAVFTGNTQQPNNAGSGLADGNWHNFVFTFENGVGTKLYIDGGTPNLDTFTGALDNDPAIVTIGSRGDGANKFNGNIDEVAIFNYALSARQVKQDIYNGTTTGKTADLNNISNLTPPVAWYRMGD